MLQFTLTPCLPMSAEYEIKYNTSAFCNKGGTSQTVHALVLLFHIASAHALIEKIDDKLNCHLSTLIVMEQS
jgi:hypothetical protein